LGGELKKLFPLAQFPSSKQLDVTRLASVINYFNHHKISLVIHAAALAVPQQAEDNPNLAIEANIIGTANIAQACLRHRAKLVYISTDYVFKGDKGNYKETDAVWPVNKYAWSKLGGEAAVRLLPDFLIIRTSFGEKVFPHKAAFIDHFTSRESVNVIGGKIAKAIKKNLSGTLHVGAKRRSVYQYAQSLNPKQEIKKISRLKVSGIIPKDTSLNTGLYKKLLG